MFILLICAIAPAAFLLYYIYRQDKVEKESPKLLGKLFLGGVIVAIPIVVVELVFDWVFLSVFSETNLFYIFISNFIGVALVEEAGKFFVLKRIWNNPEFNYLFDAIVYGVFVALGFAAIENILYVVGEGTLDIALVRGILSVPSHAIDGVFMGYFFGLAKRASVLGNVKSSKTNMALALVVPVLLHGFFDFCLSVDSDALIVAFFVFVVIMYIIAFVRVKKSSKEDVPLFNSPIPPIPTNSR